MFHYHLGLQQHPKIFSCKRSLYSYGWWGHYNTTGCSTTCLNPINSNGDLETEGLLPTLTLYFQFHTCTSHYHYCCSSLLVRKIWNQCNQHFYFQGVSALKRQVLPVTPMVAPHDFTFNGGWVSVLSSLATNTNVQCGKTYKFSAWIAVYTNGATQYDATFGFRNIHHSSSSANVIFQ